MDLKDPRVLAGMAAGLLLICLLASLIIRTSIRRRRSNRAYQAARVARLAALNALIERIMADDLAAYREVLDVNNQGHNDSWGLFVYHEYDTELSNRYQSAMRHGEQLSNYETVLASARKKMREVRAADNSDRRITCLIAFLHAMQEAHTDNTERIYEVLGLNHTKALNYLNRSIEERYEELLSDAEDGDASAFLLLDDLIRDTRTSNRGMFRGLGVTGLSRPPAATWNALVVKLFENPDLPLFERDEMKLGDVLHLAARAEASGNLVDMQLALAFHNHSGRQQSEIPDEIVAALIRKVAAHIAAKKRDSMEPRTS
jgi:hypothetical protein